MSAYGAEGWSDLAVAGAGAAGALTGLLFVAVSINLQRILEFPHLPDRVAGTLGLVMTVLLVCIFILAPQERVALGTEITAVGVVMSAGAVRSAVPRLRAEHVPVTWILSSLLILLVPALTFVVGGISLLAEAGGGLYWVFAGICVGFVAAVVNTWVLLIEIQR